MGTYIKRLKDEFEAIKGKKKPTVTVSGFSGSGKTTLARTIAKNTSLKHKKAGQIFRNLAKQRGMSLEEFSKKREDEVDLMVDKKTLEKAIEGGYVLDARLSAWVAGDFADLKIFMKIDPQIAAKRVAEREDISSEEALKNVKKRDKADKSKYKKLYDIDFNDLSIFDFVINNGLISIEELRKLGRIISDTVKRIDSKGQ